MTQGRGRSDTSTITLVDDGIVELLLVLLLSSERSIQFDSKENKRWNQKRTIKKACLIVGVCGIRILPQKRKGCNKYFGVQLHNKKEVKCKGQLPPLPTTTDYNDYRPCQQKYTKNTTVPSIVVCGDS